MDQMAVDNPLRLRNVAGFPRIRFGSVRQPE
jgi:hypothetical protein